MREHTLRAIRLAEAGQTDEALRLLRIIVQRDPTEGPAWKWLAYLTPDPREALIAARRAFQLEPGDTWVREVLPALEARALSASGPAPYASPRRARPARRQQRTGGCAFLGFTLGTATLLLVTLAAALLLMWRQFTGVPAQESAIVPPGESVLANPPLEMGAGIAQEAPVEPVLPPEPGSPTLTAALVPEVRVTTATETYTFQAGTVSEIQEALYSQGPTLDSGENSIAMTNYQMGVEWQAVQSLTACGLAEAVVHLDITYVYPEWQPTGSPPEALFAEWERFMAHVTAHEQRHGEIAQDCAHVLANRLAAIGPQPSCEALNARINAAIDEMYGVCEAQQAEYDAAEGRTSFPLP